MKKNNRLVVLAHPTKKSLNHEIAKTIVENSESAFLIDLYEKEWRQDFLEFQDIKKDLPKNETFKKIREKIEWADELIFVHPVWWTSQPAILKNFIDNNFTSGFAFEYQDDGKPRGLLNKNARIFVTADSPKFMMIFLKPFMKMVFVKAVLDFCNVKTLNFDIFPDMTKKRSEGERKKILEKVVSILDK